MLGIKDPHNSFDDICHQFFRLLNNAEKRSIISGLLTLTFKQLALCGFMPNSVFHTANQLPRIYNYASWQFLDVAGL